jgi:probable rRNA maturation factor
MIGSRRLLIANRHPRLRLERGALTTMIAALDAHAHQFRGGCPAGELSLVFLTDTALAKLHAGFLDDPTMTDVITFAASDTNLPMIGEEKSAGEICVSADAATRHLRPRRGAKMKRSSSVDLSDEITLYVVHGWLHLAGYDDLEPAKKREMRRAEARAMKLLRLTDALPRFTLRVGRATV